MKRVKYDPTLPTIPGGEREIRAVEEIGITIGNLFSAEELQLIKGCADKEGVSLAVLVRVLVMGGLQSFKK